jgi:adhesin transport system outer membrane protein
MLLIPIRRPRLGALLFFAWLGICNGPVLAADAAPMARPAATGGEKLQVHAVADQLNAFLGKAVEWVDIPASRVPVSSIRQRIRAAVLAHPEVRLAAEQQQTATQVTREAFAGFLPQVSTNVDAGRRSVDLVSTPWSFVPAHDEKSRSVGIVARQLLYDFGAVGGRVDAQTSRETAADAKSEARRSELALRALSAWHEVFRARQIVNLSSVNRLSRQQILSFIEEREQLGGSSRSDVLRVRARLSDAQAALVFAQSRLDAAEATYREVFDATPPADLPLPEIVALDLARFADVARLAQQNALIAEAQAQSDAARYDAKSAAASMLPSVHLEVSATRRDMGGEGVVPGVDKAALVVFRHNLYSGGAEAARARQAEHRATESKFEEDNLRRQLERAITQTIADVKNSNAVVAARKETVQVAALAFEAVREQFAFRRGTLLDLLRAQEDLYLAGRDMIDGVVDHALARYRLLHLGMDLVPMFEITAAAAARKE